MKQDQAISVVILSNDSDECGESMKMSTVNLEMWGWSMRVQKLKTTTKVQINTFK